jgi:hypothetical protein
MKTELFYLALPVALTGLLWVPSILDRVAVWGLMDAVGYPANPKPQSFLRAGGHRLADPLSTGL